MAAGKKTVCTALLGVLIWGTVAWLFVATPVFVVESLPAILPLSVFAFLLFLAGLVLLAVACLSFLRIGSLWRAHVVILGAASLIVLYNLSPLAPAWECFGQRLYVRFVNAAGQNCTTTCTDNKAKPCSGWSSCWDKNVSCSSSGIDQDGRPCNGCCFSCTLECDEPDPDPALAPSITGSVSCSKTGLNGWCTGTSSLNLTASDPQNFTLTISGTINGSPFTCPAGTSCSIVLPEGSGLISFKATAAPSGLASTTSTLNWKRDITVPTIQTLYANPTGTNGWHVLSPVEVSAGGSDGLSGLSSAQVSVNGGGWQAGASLSDGIYTVNFRALDNAGNSSTLTRTIKVDATPPIVTPVISSPDGKNGWFMTTPVDVSVNGADTGSGLTSTLLSVDNGPWQTSASLHDGLKTIRFMSTDQAGNTATVTHSVRIDSTPPSIQASVSGTAGSAGWYISPTLTTISTNDLSGLDRIEFNQNEEGWETGTSFVSGQGINTIDLRAYDVAGNVAIGSVEIKIDTTAPVISTSVSGVRGLAGWYVSTVETEILASDDLSGLGQVEYNQNANGWKSGTSFASGDGIHTIHVQAYDVAGNVSTGSLEIRVDTIAPEVVPVIPVPDGLNSWFVTAPVNVSVDGSDSGSGLASTQVSADRGDWETSAALEDGVHNIDFRIVDNAGNSATVSQIVKIDTVAPALSTSVSGMPGNHGWFLSAATTGISAWDETSGVDHIEYEQNNAGWIEGTSVVSRDGNNTLHVRASDLAGNMANSVLQVKVDTEKPVSKFTPMVSGSSVVRGPYQVSGVSEDVISGVSAAEISIDGETWIPLVFSSGSIWAYDWDTTSWPDGIYHLIVRSVDNAGNREPVESAARLTLLVNNQPPRIKLTPEWFIWEAGSLVIETEYFPIRDGQIVIRDPGSDESVIRIPFGEKYPSKINWDRRFENGILAPSGNYPVTVSACNVYDLCAEKSATIKIPWYSGVLPTEPAHTQVAGEEPKFQSPDIPLEGKDSPGVVIFEHSRYAASKFEQMPLRSLLSLLVFVALMWVTSSAALADRRPAAIWAMAKTIRIQNRIGEFQND